MNSTVVSQAPRHVAALDVVRGLAALAVALLHLREVNWIGMRAYWTAHHMDFSLSSVVAYLSFPVVWGSIGVPIFFVLSGYVIHRSSRYSIESWGHARNFWLRRWVRIYPVFIAAIVLTLVCDLIARQYGTSEKLGDLSLGNAVLNLLALVGLAGTPYGSDGALWSLAIEIQFYALYPLALLAWRRLGAGRMLLFTLALSAVGYLLFQRWGLKFFLTYYFSWWLGAYVADCDGQGGPRGRSLVVAGLFTAAGCAVFFTRDELLTHALWSVGFAFLLNALVNAPLQAAAAQPARRRGGLKAWTYGALRRCGDFSYSLYAVHLPVAVVFNVLVWGGQKQDSILWVPLSLMVTLMAAYGVYCLVEVPSMRLLKRLPR